MNSDPGGSAGGLQGAQAGDDCSGADTYCNIRVDRNSAQKLCSSTAGNCEPEDPIFHPSCATGGGQEFFDPGCSSGPCCGCLNNLRK